MKPGGESMSQRRQKMSSFSYSCANRVQADRVFTFTIPVPENSSEDELYVRDKLQSIAFQAKKESKILSGREGKHLRCRNEVINGFI